jgi:hypothetical protein
MVPLNLKNDSGTLYPGILAIGIESGCGHLARLKTTNTRQNPALWSPIIQKTCFYPLCLEPVPGTKFQFTLINVLKNKRKTGISISIGTG